MAIIGYIVIIRFLHLGIILFTLHIRNGHDCFVTLNVTSMQGISSPVGRVFYYDDRLTTQKNDTA